MPFKIPKPSEDGVQELFRHLHDQWNPALKVSESFRDLILQKNVVDTLSQDEKKNMTPIQFHSGRPGGIVEHARGLLMAIPSFGVSPPNDSTEEKRPAEQTERTLAQVFKQQLIATDFWPQTVRDALAYGIAFVKALPLPNYWTIRAGYPVRNKTESSQTYLNRIRKWKDEEAKFPFVIMHVPRFNVLPLVDAEDNVIASIEVKRVMAGVLAELGVSKAKQDISSGACPWYKEMIVLEYMDAEYVSYFVSNAQIDPQDFSDLTHTTFEQFRTWKHGLGRCPMVLLAGIKTGEIALEDRYKSFLWDAKEALENYDFLLSRLATMVWAYYLPSYVWTILGTSTAYAGKERPTFKINLGGVTVKYQDEALDPLPYPAGLPDANLLLQEADSIIQRHTLEDVLFGRVQGSAPAFQVNLRINVARSKLTPIAQHLAQGVERVADLFLRGVLCLGEEVVVDGEEITPAMAKKAIGRIRVSINPRSPVDRNSDIGTAQMALAPPLAMPWDWVVENLLNEEDPATIRLAKDIQALEERPEAQDKLLQEALSDLDLAIEEEEFEDSAGIDMGALPEGMRAALEGKMGAGDALGRGPYPPGMAPQTIGGGRGLLTQKSQPQPTGVQVGDETVV